LTRPGLKDGYPMDLLREWCVDYVDAGIWSYNLDTDLGRECRHAFGHGIFYAVAKASLDKEHQSARVQFRPHMYDTSKELQDKMFKICNDAPLNKLTMTECRGGIQHSIDLLQKTNPPILSMSRSKGKNTGPPKNFETIDMFKARNKAEEAGGKVINAKESKPNVDSPLRVAMMGSGIWAKMSHKPILQRNPNVFDMKAVWSRHMEGAASLASDFQKKLPQRNCTAYAGEEGLASLLGREDIDAIIMSLPLDLQPTYVFRVLESGKHVLSEKPTAGTTKEGWEAIQMYREKYRPKGLVWAVAEDYRYNGLYTETARAVRETMGPMKTLDFSIQMKMVPGSFWLKTEWRAKSSWGDLGFFIDGVVHFVSGFRFIATSQPVAVRANLTSNLDYMPGYDSLHAIVEFGDGTNGTFEASYTNAGGGAEEIFASDGRDGNVTFLPGSGLTDGKGTSTKVGGDGKPKVFLSFAKDCKNAGEGGGNGSNDDSNITPEQSLLDVAFLEACLESSLAGGQMREIRTSLRL